MDAGESVGAREPEVDQWWAHYESIEANLRDLSARGFLAEEEFAGVDVLDFGGSSGQLARLALARGAKSATVVDIDLPVELYESRFADVAGLHYHRSTVEDYLSDHPTAAGRFDLIVSHAVTEHVHGLATALEAIRELLAPRGLLFIVHDNYYHPSGAHDNFILTVGGDGVYRYAGPECWSAPDRCEASRDLRESMNADLPPWLYRGLWDERTERQLDPENCDACPLRKRATPWAHLLYQDEFPEVFPQEFFTSGAARSGLNKLTPFQLRQYLIEAGFRLELWERTYVANEPPAQLLESPFYFNAEDLRTVNVFARCRKR